MCPKLLILVAHDDPLVRTVVNALLRMAPSKLDRMERAKGYRAILAHCHLCHRRSAVDLSFFPDELPIPDIQPRLRCSVCGSKERLTITVNVHEHYAMVDKARREQS